jgi:cupin superfamily acireductone dioxygenase involved in methionine salvage
MPHIKREKQPLEVYYSMLKAQALNTYLKKKLEQETKHKRIMKEIQDKLEYTVSYYDDLISKLPKTS